MTGATSQRELSTPPSSSDPVKGGELLTTVKKKPNRKDEDNSMNYTRIVKRTMNEILGIGCEDEPPKKRPGRPQSGMKKQNSDSLMQGLRLSRNGIVRQTVPAKFRDM